VNLPFILDYLIGNGDGSFKAFDQRLILYIASIREYFIRWAPLPMDTAVVADLIYRQKEPSASFTAELIKSLVPKVFGGTIRPLDKMEPCQIGLQLEMPFQSQRKGAKVKCETPGTPAHTAPWGAPILIPATQGCANRSAELDPKLKQVGLHVCTKCMGVQNFFLASEVCPTSAAGKIVKQLSQPQVLTSRLSREAWY
jgi:hypothetical protein